MDDFVTAVSVTTGKKQRIPAGWLDHPVFGKDWKLPPSAAAAQDAMATPDTTTTDQVNVVDPPPVVDANTAPPTAAPGDPNTPAAGGEQEN